MIDARASLPICGRGHGRMIRITDNGGLLVIWGAVMLCSSSSAQEAPSRHYLSAASSPLTLEVMVNPLHISDPGKLLSWETYFRSKTEVPTVKLLKYTRFAMYWHLDQHHSVLLTTKCLVHRFSLGSHSLLTLLLSACTSYAVAVWGAETPPSVALVMRSSLKCEILDVIMGLESS